MGGSFAYLGPPPLVNERALPLRLGRSTHRPSAEPDEVLEKPGEKTSSTRRSTRNRHPKQPTKPTRRRRRRRRNRLATPATAVGAILYANERGEPRKRPIAVVKCGHHRDCSVLSSFFCLFVFLLLFFFHPVFHFVLFFCNFTSAFYETPVAIKRPPPTPKKRHRLGAGCARNSVKTCAKLGKKNVASTHPSTSHPPPGRPLRKREQLAGTRRCAKLGKRRCAKLGKRRCAKLGNRRQVGR